MTEKGFKTRLAGMTPGLDLEAALALAKEAGAKFDPEPVELPVLNVRAIEIFDVPLFAVVAKGHLHLNQVELVEVVRRCNAWPEILRVLRDVAADWEGPRLWRELERLVKIMEGRAT